MQSLGEIGIYGSWNVCLRDHAFFLIRISAAIAT